MWRREKCDTAFCMREIVLMSEGLYREGTREEDGKRGQ